MKTGLWLAIAFNLAAVAILAVVTITAGNGAAAQNPYGSSVGPLYGPIRTVLGPTSPMRTDASAHPPRPEHQPPAQAHDADSAHRSDPNAATPEPSPLPWLESPDGTARLLP